MNGPRPKEIYAITSTIPRILSRAAVLGAIQESDQSTIQGAIKKGVR